MPVIVVGADTPLGAAVTAALLPRPGEVRVFVSDVDVATSLKAKGAKTAVGDVSDGSHVGGAALNAFCAVLISTATADDRERSFADTPATVAAAWIEGLVDAGVQRVIWVEDPDIAVTMTAGDLPAGVEFAAVAAAGRSGEDVAAEVAALDAAASLA